MLKKTKIIATISDLNCGEELIKKLHETGVDVVRLNTAHQDFEGTKRVINNVRKVSKKIPFLLDTKGPEIRTSKSNKEIAVKKGDKIFVDGNPDKEISEECIYVTYPNFSKDLSVKDKILIDDGDVELEVVEKKGGKLFCVVKNDGIIKGKKSVNVPNVHIHLPSLSKKDLEYINFAVENNIDFIAHSFVRNREDLQEIQKILDKKKSKIKIIAKIENQEGVDKIDEILEHCYGVMIARGDLGIELPAEKIPIVQREIIKKCIEKRKPVIVATQMLHTMINNPRPTRAEVSDVANAIFLGADAIMLSGETAYGKYPLEAVRTMTEIAKEIESNKICFDDSSVKSINKEIVGFLTKSAVRASLQLPTKAIIIDTKTGRTARYISAYRGKNLIFALCYDEKVMRELALSYGVYPTFGKTKKTTREFIRELVIPMVEKAHFKKDDLIIVVAGSFGPSHGASFLEISTVENLIR